MKATRRLPLIMLGPPHDSGERRKFRKMGLEPIPKLNFAAGHDIWLGKYSRMVSTDTYYGVCSDLIEEVIDLFDKPRFFHLGMDEENAEDQRYLNLVVIRQHDLWWHDFYFFLNRSRKRDPLVDMVRLFMGNTSG